MWPVVGIDSSMPAAMSGSRPMVTNSVVPIANPPSASDRIARPTWEVRDAGRRLERGHVVVKSAGPVAIPWARR